MPESMGYIPKKVVEKTKKVFREQLAPKIINGLLESSDSVHKFATKHLEQLGVKPVFVQENNPQFQEMRNKLNTESGIIISNHPGWGDTALILSILKREDVKVMMNKNFFDLLPPEVADKYFFPNEQDPAKAITIFKSIQEHIKNGGLLLMYPSGGNEQKEGADFKDGFRVVLRGLESQQMVYCFNINTEDMEIFKSQHSKMGLASEMLMPSSSHTKKSKNSEKIRINEAYTQASHWQEATQGIPKDDRNKILTEKYENMFLSNKN